MELSAVGSAPESRFTQERQRSSRLSVLHPPLRKRVRCATQAIGLLKATTLSASSPSALTATATDGSASKFDGEPWSKSCCAERRRSAPFWSAVAEQWMCSRATTDEFRAS
jgi:hypothetical protein